MGGIKVRTEEFNKILKNRLKKISDVLGKKAGEYAFNDNRLYNFQAAGRVNGVSTQQALWGMATKHLVSVIDLVEGRLDASEKNIDEKIGDLINYLILMEAILLGKAQ